jgi:hypothetical protein
MAQLSQQLNQERIARRQAEYQVAGLRSTVVRLQALLARQRAEDAAATAEQHV